MNDSDYIMRTIRQFSQVLAALLFGKRDAGQAVTFNDLDELSLNFTGLSLDFLQSLPTDQVLSLFAATGDLDVDKVYVTAALLHQLAEQEPQASARRLELSKKALRLLSEIRYRLGDYLNEEHESLTETMGSFVEQYQCYD